MEYDQVISPEDAVAEAAVVKGKHEEIKLRCSVRKADSNNLISNLMVEFIIKMIHFVG